ncbi:MAG: oligosaccharide flippase family protein [Planctomycetota bacterium]
MTSAILSTSRPAESAARPRQRSLLRAATALSDQAVVSGISFLTTIMIGRICGKSELGIYSMGMSVVVLAIAAQQSLVSAAHTVFSVRLQGDLRRRYNGSIAVQFAALNLLIAATLGLSAIGFWIWLPGSETAKILGPLAIVCPCVLLREFARRFEFASFQVTRALMLDGLIAAVQVVLLAMLAYSTWLSGVAGLWVVATASGLCAAGWWTLSRRQFQLSGGDHADEFVRGWQFGRWVFGGQMAFAMVGFSMQWMTAGLIGEAAVGVYGACMTLVMLSNPVVLGLQNLLSPSIASAMHQGGAASVRRLVAKATAAFTLLLSTFATVVFFLGDRLLSFIYGSQFAGNGLTISLLCLGVFASAVGVSFNHGLRTLERPEFNFVASVLGLVAGALTAWTLIPNWGVSGAACGYATSCTVTAVVRLISFLIVSWSAPNSQSVSDSHSGSEGQD